MSKVFVIPDVYLKPWILIDLAQKYKSDYKRRYCHE